MNGWDGLCYFKTRATNTMGCVVLTFAPCSICNRQAEPVETTSPKFATDIFVDKPPSACAFGGGRRGRIDGNNFNSPTFIERS